MLIYVALLQFNSIYVCLPLGDTLLAIRAPSGTQLEVPVPESVSTACVSIKIHWISDKYLINSFT